MSFRMKLWRKVVVGYIVIDVIQDEALEEGGCWLYCY